MVKAEKKVIKNSSILPVTKRKYRSKRGKKALQNIRRAQKKTDFIIPRTCIRRQSQLYAKDQLYFSKTEPRFTKGAIGLTHIALESFLMKVLKNANDMSCLHNRQSIIKGGVTLTYSIMKD